MKHESKEIVISIRANVFLLLKRFIQYSYFIWRKRFTYDYISDDEKRIIAGDILRKRKLSYTIQLYQGRVNKPKSIDISEILNELFVIINSKIII